MAHGSLGGSAAWQLRRGVLPRLRRLPLHRALPCRPHHVAGGPKAGGIASGDQVRHVANGLPPQRLLDAACRVTETNSYWSGLSHHPTTTGLHKVGTAIKLFFARPSPASGVEDCSQQSFSLTTEARR